MMKLGRSIQCFCMAVLIMTVLMLVCTDFVSATYDEAKGLLVLTADGQLKDAHKRLLRSAKVYKYDIEVLGDGKVEMDNVSELKYLRDTVAKKSAENADRLLLYIDGPDAIITAGPIRIVEEFESSDAGILFGAVGMVNPEGGFEDFPKVQNGRRFLDAGAFVGTANAINSLLKEFPDETELEKLLVKAYTKEATRKKHNLKIDHISNLFQHLDGSTGDMELRSLGREGYLQNSMYSTVPVVVKASGNTIVNLNSYGSYLARSWNSVDGCRECWEDMTLLETKEEPDYPILTIAAFIEKPTPFMDEFMENLKNTTYPKSHIYLYIHNSVEYYEEKLEKWIEENKAEYKSVEYIPRADNIKEWHAKNSAIEYCLERADCSHLFLVDSTAQITNPYTLRLLMEQNRRIIAPLLPRPGKAWSNFWGALTSDGFYARSDDYMEIVGNQRRGLWNVPYISQSFLIQRKLLEDPIAKPSFISNILDPDMALCKNLRENGVFMFVSNRVDLGHSVFADNFNVNNMNPELWEVFENRYDWEKRYLHENYSRSLENKTNETPCSDVFWFPLFTMRYCKELIDTLENYGSWSDGTHSDARLEGGYESVPTVDIHMKQVGYENEWLEILRAFVQPVQLKVFPDYYNDVGPPRALMSFMVRYKPEEQPLLRPHHDTSTYTINVAMNTHLLDYKGGGCRFVRQNCSVVDTRPGWLLMHPGRLTHLHEGLRTTEGTRYIMVTFIDP